MNGGVGLTGQSPCAAWMSVWHRPEVSTLTSTSPGPGTGIGTSSKLSGWLKSWTTAAFTGDLLRCRVRTRTGTGLRPGRSPAGGTDGCDDRRIHKDLICVYRLTDLVTHFPAPPGRLVAAERQRWFEVGVTVHPFGVRPVAARATAVPKPGIADLKCPSPPGVARRIPLSLGRPCGAALPG